ncbi:zinc metallopeptidase [Sedimentibacter sp. zth1]|uniref:zinc metallopeptidase n=1 Tax=Sedimentibacter sp. zth1 TaxID=2816908 RepID=UPI001A914001|nr:zinc metallopeptidase [Sedimentibacter sp. zth1]QSX06861.1 zinc metallopeptidase [Sedimentibacter sp. zth1]
MHFFFDPTYIIILPAIIFSMYAQTKIQSTYSRFQNVKSAKGMTGYESAQKLLNNNGLNNVTIEMVKGRLTDHYDPRKKVLRLSDGIYYGNSVAALGVAAHEVGHAIQHDKGYAPLKIRNILVPVASFSSKFSFLLLFLGILLGNKTFVDFGIYLFSAIVLFQIITLPVEFDASNRAVYQLVDNGIIYDYEKTSVKKVLNAAALTYVAATLMSVLQLLRLLAISGRFRDRD